jgi:UDP-N-acetylmuramate dehydrogenase
MPEAYTLVEQAALARLNTLGVAATARWLAEVRDAAALPAVLALPAVSGAPAMVLGEGSNVLFAANFPGLILRTAFGAVRILDDDGSTALVRAEAGAGWDALVDWTLARGLAGLENLALIPGHVGAAPIQNIGAYGAEVAGSIETVEAWNRPAARFERLEAGQCAFAYRDSVFKRQHDARPRLDYAGMREELATQGITAAPTARQVADAVRRLRRRKLPDPAVIGNAGSFFKNPVVDAALATRIRAEHAQAPVYPGGDGRSKLSAAWLIERCGWRGHRAGDAGISAQHALVLVNHGNATGAELLALARRVADSVEQRFGVRLEPEPRIVGARW